MRVVAVHDDVALLPLLAHGVEGVGRDDSGRVVVLLGVVAEIAAVRRVHVRLFTVRRTRNESCEGELVLCTGCDAIECINSQVMIWLLLRT
jgi:hypothetical protein